MTTKIMGLTDAYADDLFEQGLNKVLTQQAEDIRIELQAEVNRMEAELAHWKEARQSAIDAGELMKTERDELRAKLAAIEAQKPAYWVGQSGNLYAGRLFAVQNGEQMVTPLYLAAGAKPDVEPPDAWDALGNIRMKLCQVCGNKRCPKATNSASDCTGSNDVGQPGSSWENVKPFGAKEPNHG